MVQIVSVNLGKYDTEPQTGGKFGIPLRYKFISTRFFGLLKENGEECIELSQTIQIIVAGSYPLGW